MQVFYAPDINSNELILGHDESRHIIRVLRMTKGAPVRLIDGKGNLYEGLITDADPGQCRIGITNVIRDFEKRNYRLHIAISPLKNTERFEWFIEKCVELGTDEITPLLCRYTEKPGIKKERINGIIISAMKQSLKASGTLLNNPVSFNEFISEGSPGKRMIAHCNNNFERKKISGLYTAGDDALILIGPEGDFSPEEIRSAIEKGFSGVQLGSSRLRTETAGVAACHSIYFINQV